jgi:4-alpha-glucanotransferase
VGLRLPAGYDQAIECQLEAEDGNVEGWRIDAAWLASEAVSGEDGQAHLEARLALPHLEMGYYKLHLRAGRQRASSLVICTPPQAYRNEQRLKDWGVFLPLYALQSARSWGCGDLTDLEELMRFIESLGGRTVATLPLLASFLQDGLYEPSPYSPASRLMWNELYVDVEPLPELESNAEARTLLASKAFQEEIERLRRERLVNYERVAALKRQALQMLSKAMTPAREQELERYLSKAPEVASYARFRAATERLGPWPAWPSRKRAGRLEAGDFDPEAERYHAYAQWVTDAQLSRFSENGNRLYLDLPVGVNGAGYDTWRWPERFLQGVSAGAPPDTFFTGGQNWGFPPLHPVANREGHYDYVIDFIRHSLRYAGRLRIDHVMGLHRLFVIPDGFDAQDGVYVRYPAEELYAILCLESQRHQTAIVGENLGTVPEYVNRALRQRGLSSMYVYPFEIAPDEEAALRTPSPTSVASLNTHDLPMFATWWAGDDINERQRIGQISDADAGQEREGRGRLRESTMRFLVEKGFLQRRRRADSAEVLHALLRFLGAGPARLALVNLEDLWGETEPQNVPGTVDRPNWRRKARYSLEEMQALPEVLEGLRVLDEERGALSRPSARPG